MKPLHWLWILFDSFSNTFLRFNLFQQVFRIYYDFKFRFNVEATLLESQKDHKIKKKKTHKKTGSIYMAQLVGHTTLTQVMI